MKKLVVILLTVLCVSAYGQSESVEEFRQDHRPDMKLFFYKSTLRMFAQLAVQFAEDGQEIPDVGKLVEGIEKIKLFGYNDSRDLPDLMKQLKKDILSEDYEVAISTKLGRGKNQFNSEILLKENKGKPAAFVIFISSEEGGMQILDIEGAPDLNNLVQFAQYVGENGNSFTLLNALR